jgi:DNA polymerase
MNDRLATARAYFCQQQELGLPDIILARGSRAPAVLSSLCTRAVPAPVHPFLQRPQPPASTDPRPGAPPRLLPVSRLMKAAVKVPAAPVLDQNNPARDSLVTLYHSVKDCKDCPLGALRNKFVFGSGNVLAPLLIVGEAPGAEEDAQGVPFVGAAGGLLTSLLDAIGLDRKKDVFITNILKCRPPGNRTPEVSEIAACARILSAQIAIIRPKAFLLLGRIAAHALLPSTAGISSLRRESHAIDGVPAFVTYHPASLLRNPEYERPAQEDLQKLKTFLVETGAYAATR